MLINPNLLFEASQIQKRYGTVLALKNGQLNLYEGTIHALCGGNGAGKSTFLSIITGLLSKDQGLIKINNKSVEFKSPQEAIDAGISIITQELSPVLGMSVAENIYLGQEKYRFGLVNYNQLNQKAQRLMINLEFMIDVKQQMSNLSLAHRQMVEIAKAFSRNSRIIIMDEPSSAIGEKETEILFHAIRQAKERGVGIIYVSHRLSEIFEICDQYTVFRDGSFIETGLIAQIDRPSLIKLIVGREITHKKSFRKPLLDQSTPILSTHKLSRKNEFKNISLDVAPGEILGIYGLTGSGRSEFINTLYGLEAPDSGDIYIKGHVYSHLSPKKALDLGLSLVTEDRKHTGLVMQASIADNLSYSLMPKMQYAGVINFKKIKLTIQKLIDMMKIKISSDQLAVGTLSGGNQQKIVLGRCMSTEPICLLCDEPTRGIDEGAKQEIYTFLDHYVKRGNAAIVISSEAPELLWIADRIAIFKQGCLIEIMNTNEATQEILLHKAS